MADSPSVVVRFMADLSALGKAAGDVGTHAQNAAGKMASAFKGVTGALGPEILGPFSGAIDGISTALDKVSEHGKSIGPMMAGVGVGVAGVGAALSVMGSKDQASHQQLQAAIAATGKSYDDYGGQVDAAIKHQEKFGNTANETQDALRILTQATGDPATALKYLGEASDLAAAKHESLSTAAEQLGRTYNGSAKLLKQFGVDSVPSATVANKQLETATREAATAADAQAKAHQHLTDVQELLKGKTHLTAAEQIQLQDAQQNVVAADAKAVDAHTKLTKAQTEAHDATQNHGKALDELGQKLKGQAAAQANTFTGHIKALKAEVEDSAAKLGQKYGPALQGAGTIMAGVGSVMGIFTKTTKAASTATEAMSAAEDTEAASSWAALGPALLIVAAIAAIIAIVYVLYRNWDTIWSGIKAIIHDVWSWIVSNWPYLLGIILGPIGIAAALIYTHFQDIKQWASDVWKWIKDGWNDLVGFFTSLPGRIESILSHMWDFIWDTFKAIINKLIDGWNSLQFKTPEIHVGPIHIGGETIGVPQIPHLAEGGLITGEGLIYAHAGEVVTPAGGGGPGPLVAINGSTFNSATDVDMIAKKLEFAMRSGQRLS